MLLGTLRASGDVVIRAGGGWLEVAAVLPAGDDRARDIVRLIADWDEVGAALREGEAAAGRGALPLRAADERLLAPPVPAPRRILCIGRNYARHAREMGHDLPTVPEVFLRLCSSMVGPRDDIVLPQGIEEVDLEAELAVVVGRGGRRIAKEAALGAVFGYTVFNDVSVRSWQYRALQWTAGKNFDRTAPCGPYIRTRESLSEEPFEVWSAIGDCEMQRGTTADLIFDIPSLIADLSTFTTLEPGDLIATGTPPGVGMGRKPPRWLREGEEVRCGVQGIGELRNVCRIG